VVLPISATRCFAITLIAAIISRRCSSKCTTLMRRPQAASGSQIIDDETEVATIIGTLIPSLLQGEGGSPPSLHAAGVAPIDGHFLDFRDPWGNRIEIVGYDNIQFTKAPNVLRGMGLTHLTKNDSAKKELAKKGCLPRNDERTSGSGLGQSIPVKRHAR
jgi:hypothetical protein